VNQIFDVVDFGLIVVGPRGNVERANRWVRDRCPAGVDPIGKPLGAAFEGAVESRLTLAVRSCLDLGNAVRLSQAFHPMPLPLYRPEEGDAERMRQAVDIVPVQVPGLPERRCLIQVRDVTETVKRERLLRQQAQRLGEELKRVTDAHHEIERQSLRFREIARLAPVGLFETDAQGMVLFGNTWASELLGQRTERMLNRFWLDPLCAEAADAQARRLRWQAAASTGMRYAEEFAVERPGRGRAWVRVESNPLRDADGALQGHIVTMSDVTEFQENAQRHEFRANHDPLTGLANRARFDRRLGMLVQASLTGQYHSALLFIDLDGFKAINDEHGHGAGDIVLRTVATRLKHCVRTDDLVARFGGDEFAVLVADVPERAIVERITGKIERVIARAINIGACHVQVRASVGIAMTPEDGADADTLFTRADAEMYRAKRARRLQDPAATATSAEFCI